MSVSNQRSRETFSFLCISFLFYCWVMSINAMAAHSVHSVTQPPFVWEICYSPVRCTFCSSGQRATHIKHSSRHDSGRRDSSNCFHWAGCRSSAASGGLPRRLAGKMGLTGKIGQIKSGWQLLNPQSNNAPLVHRSLKWSRGIFILADTHICTNAAF